MSMALGELTQDCSFVWMTWLRAVSVFGLELIHGTVLLGAIRPCFMAVFGLELRE